MNLAIVSGGSLLQEESPLYVICAKDQTFGVSEKLELRTFSISEDQSKREKLAH